jgi:hypothetical protein
VPTPAPQLRAVDDARLQRVLERPLLRRRELVVDEEDLGAGVLVRLLQLLELALADVGAHVRSRPHLHELAHGLDARGPRELAELPELLVRGVGRREHGDREAALGLDARSGIRPALRHAEDYAPPANQEGSRVGSPIGPLPYRDTGGRDILGTMDYEPPDFIAVAGEDESWSQEDWQLWTNSGQPLFEDVYLVKVLCRSAGVLEARGSTVASSAFVLVDESEAKPTHEALERLGQELRQLTNVAEEEIRKRLEHPGVALRVDFGVGEAVTVTLERRGEERDPIRGAGQTLLQALTDAERQWNERQLGKADQPSPAD